jgi:hypothetical protein
VALGLVFGTLSTEPKQVAGDVVMATALDAGPLLPFKLRATNPSHPCLDRGRLKAALAR